MPCRDYSDYEYTQIVQRRLNDVTRLLCKMLNHFGPISGDDELAAWKEEHDELDRRHAAAEREAEVQRQKRVQQTALLESARAKLATMALGEPATLTPEEAEALKAANR